MLVDPTSGARGATRARSGSALDLGRVDGLERKQLVRHTRIASSLLLGKKALPVWATPRVVLEALAWPRRSTRTPLDQLQTVVVAYPAIRMLRDVGVGDVRLGEEGGVNLVHVVKLHRRPSTAVQGLGGGSLVPVTGVNGAARRGRRANGNQRSVKDGARASPLEHAGDGGNVNAHKLGGDEASVQLSSTSIVVPLLGSVGGGRVQGEQHHRACVVLVRTQLGLQQLDAAGEVGGALARDDSASSVELGLQGEAICRGEVAQHLSDDVERALVVAAEGEVGVGPADAANAVAQDEIANASGLQDEVEHSRAGRVGQEGDLNVTQLGLVGEARKALRHLNEVDVQQDLGDGGLNLGDLARVVLAALEELDEALRGGERADRLRLLQVARCSPQHAADGGVGDSFSRQERQLEERRDEPQVEEGLVESQADLVIGQRALLWAGTYRRNADLSGLDL